MKIKKWILLVILVILLVSTINFAKAEENNEEKEEETGGIAGAIFNIFFGSMKEMITKIFEIIAESIQSLIDTVIAKLLNMHPENGKGHIKLWNLFFAISSSLIGLLVLYTGFMWIKSGGEVKKVEEAKTQFKNLIFMFIFIFAFPFIIEFAFEIINLIVMAISNMLINVDELVIGLMDVFLDATAVFLIGWVALGLWALLGVGLFAILIAVRYLLVLLLLAMSPIIIMLYFFLPTQQIGKRLLKLLAVNMVMPIVWVTVFGIALQPKIPMLQGILVFGSFFLNIYLYFKLTDIVSSPAKKAISIPRTVVKYIIKK